MEVDLYNMLVSIIQQNKSLSDQVVSLKNDLDQLKDLLSKPVSMGIVDRRNAQPVIDRMTEAGKRTLQQQRVNQNSQQVIRKPIPKKEEIDESELADGTESEQEEQDDSEADYGEIQI